MAIESKKQKRIPKTMKQKVWNYMRRNRNFIVGDIMAITGIQYANLRDILKVYEIVGYVEALSKEKPLTSNRYRLIKYTGVRTPTYDRRKQLFYDHNLDITLELKRVPSILKIINAMHKSPISKEEINRVTKLSHATNVKCYAKLKKLGIITRIAPIQKSSEGYMLFTIDFEKLEKHKEEI